MMADCWGDARNNSERVVEKRGEDNLPESGAAYNQLIHQFQMYNKLLALNWLPSFWPTDTLCQMYVCMYVCVCVYVASYLPKPFY